MEGKELSLGPPVVHQQTRGYALGSVYEEEIGISYPFLLIHRIVAKVNVLYNALEAASQNGIGFTVLPGPSVIDPDDLYIIKLALATAMIIETSGLRALGIRRFESVKGSVHHKMWQPATIKSTVFFTLLVGQADPGLLTGIN